MFVTASAYEVIELALASLDPKSASYGEPLLLVAAARWPPESQPLRPNLFDGLQFTIAKADMASDVYFDMFASSLNFAERLANGYHRHAIRVSDILFGAYQAVQLHMKIMNSASLDNMIENRMEQQQFAENQQNVCAGRRTLGVLFGVCAYYKDGTCEVENKFMRFDHAVRAKHAFERLAHHRPVEETSERQSDYFFIFPPREMEQVERFTLCAIRDE